MCRSLPRAVRTSVSQGSQKEEDWSRVAELQGRNLACPPHMKTSYPVEPKSLSTVSEEDLKTGDPRETLRRATLLPGEIAEGRATRRSTLGSGATGGGATRQQSQQSPRTAESSYSDGIPKEWTTLECSLQGTEAACLQLRSDNLGPKVEKMAKFLRFMVLHEECLGEDLENFLQRKSKCQPERRQALAFTVLNSPKKPGSSLLRRGANRKVTPAKSPGSRRPPWAAAPLKGKGGSWAPLLSQSLSQLLSTEEDLKTGDPRETLWQATLLPGKIAEGRATRRSTLGSGAQAGGGTRQQRKRPLEESQQGPGTPEQTDSLQEQNLWKTLVTNGLKKKKKVVKRNQSVPYITSF
ncbi:hypothetical protein lerEdw1_011166 [Lerista edwardsae]|nr:hypothetical protein lerEdw1_011166 [Lerista edwardsae]